MEALLCTRGNSDSAASRLIVGLAFFSLRESASFLNSRRAASVDWYLRFVKSPEFLCGRRDRGGIARLGSSLAMRLSGRSFDYSVAVDDGDAKDAFR
jgi:hypothetical protein